MTGEIDMVENGRGVVCATGSIDKGSTSDREREAISVSAVLVWPDVIDSLQMVGRVD